MTARDSVSLCLASTGQVRQPLVLVHGISYLPMFYLTWWAGSPIGLHDGVRKYAAVSAFEDRRSPTHRHRRYVNFGQLLVR